MYRITLPSNASMNYFPNNTLSNFSVKPPVPIVDGEDYECALSEIIFPNRFINVRAPNNSIIVRRTVGSEEEQEANKKTFAVPTGSYESISELLKAIRDAGVDGIVKRKAPGLPDFPFGDSDTWRVIIMEEVGGRVKITPRLGYTIQFGSDISTLLGFHYLNSGVHKGMSNIISSAVIGPLRASTSGGLNTMYVYTNIIKDQPVGGIAVPLLRIINLERGSNREDFSSRMYTRLYYVPLRASRFDTINIQLRDDTGELIHFEYGKVVLILEFRRKKTAI
jgi:hypothetical protein